MIIHQIHPCLSVGVCSHSVGVFVCVFVYVSRRVGLQVQMQVCDILNI
jgi:hypothetical protein